MVGYKESKHSFNDPRDIWEQTVKALKKFVTSGKPMPKTDPEHPDFWSSVPRYSDDPRDLITTNPKDATYRKALEMTRGKGSKGFKPPKKK